MARLLPRLLTASARLRRAPKAPIPNVDADGSLVHAKDKLEARGGYRPLLADFSRSRSRSILLDPINPIIHPKLFVARKSRALKSTRDAGTDDLLLKSQELYQSNPYLRMLGSPTRKCIISNRLLPSAFLLRLSTSSLPDARVKPGKERVFLLPDGLEHPLFRTKNSGRASYVFCYKDAVEELVFRGLFKRIHLAAELHPLFVEQIGHQLRQRVLQELELLIDQISTRKETSGTESAPILRRLNRSEWSEFKTRGFLKDLNSAVALLVVPKLNNPKPVQPQSQSDAAQQDTAATPLIKRHFPLSSLHEVASSPDAATSPESSADNTTQPNALSKRFVPIYNGPAFFPDREQRGTLRKQLNKLVAVEMERQLRSTTASPKKEALEKPSDAYLLRSDGDTLLRADTVPFAIACWRVRIWEGQGWGDDTMGHHR